MPTPNAPAPAPAAPANDAPQESPARKFFAVAQVRPALRAVPAAGGPDRVPCYQQIVLAIVVSQVGTQHPLRRRA